MGKVDRFNGGFIGGSRTSDNIFILRGLVQRQMIIGESRFVCFVDFSKTFDMLNRQILFYKMMKGGWTGRVIDTLRNLHSKTHYRVKRGGKLGPPIESLTGVNQGGGGSASGILFRKYLQDSDEYLKKDAVSVLVKHLLRICFGPMMLYYSQIQKRPSKNRLMVSNVFVHAIRWLSMKPRQNWWFLVKKSLPRR